MPSQKAKTSMCFPPRGETMLLRGREVSFVLDTRTP